MLKTKTERKRKKKGVFKKESSPTTPYRKKTTGSFPQRSKEKDSDNLFYFLTSGSKYQLQNFKCCGRKYYSGVVHYWRCSCGLSTSPKNPQILSALASSLTNELVLPFDGGKIQ